MGYFQHGEHGRRNGQQLLWKSDRWIFRAAVRYERHDYAIVSGQSTGGRIRVIVRAWRRVYLRQNWNARWVFAGSAVIRRRVAWLNEGHRGSEDHDVG